MLAKLSKDIIFSLHAVTYAERNEAGGLTVGIGAGGQANLGGREAVAAWELIDTAVDRMQGMFLRCTPTTIINVATVAIAVMQAGGELQVSFATGGFIQFQVGDAPAVFEMLTMACQAFADGTVPPEPKRPKLAGGIIIPDGTSPLPRSARKPKR
jgi:hypothetical protein